MKKTRNMGIIIVSLGLILLILLIYFTFFRGEEVVPEPEPEEIPSDIGLPESDEPTITPGDRPRDISVYDISQEDERDMDEEDVSSIAMLFASRFGTFSSQSNFSNIIDSQLFMTRSLRDWSNDYLSQLRQENPADVYYGITSQALNSRVIMFDDNLGEAEIMVTTYRSEVGDEIDGENNFYQDLLLEFKVENDSWKVNAIYWQD